MKTDNAILQSAPETTKTGSSTLVFREITEANELEEAFRLRYSVYSCCHNNILLTQNGFNLDIDIYDLHSKHYGLYTDNDELIAYLRVVLNKNNYCNYTAWCIGKKYCFFSEALGVTGQISSYESVDYPFLSYTGIPESIKAFYKELRKTDSRLIEASRLVIKEECRGLRASSFLIECALVHYLLINKSNTHAIISCVKEHRVFYERYGFGLICGEEGYNSFRSSIISMCLSLSLSNVPGYFHSKFEQMAAEFNITGEIRNTIG